MAAERTRAEPELDHNAIGFLDALVIGLASTAPAYSLAAVIGTVTVVVGFQAPGALLASFVPMFLIAAAFFYMNKADQDAGTSFSWITRTMGPWFGWIGGWAICTTGILVIGSLADVGARYFYLLFGWDGAAGSKTAVMVLAVAAIVIMTAICIIGTEVSARLQSVMIIGQVGALLLFAIVAIVKVFSGDGREGSVKPSGSWFSPFEVSSFSALVSAMLIGVFIYWGWESAVNLTEETRDGTRAPGMAAVVSTIVLVVTYLLVSTAVVSFAGLETLADFDDDDAIFSFLAADVLGSPWDKLVVLSIVTSALASTQTTIIPASRTSFSMARQNALPGLFARIHPRFRTPWFSTVVIAALAIAWYVPVNAASENFLFDTLSALSLMIAFYYALTGIACAIFYRHRLLHSVKNLVFIGIAPLVGSVILGYLCIKSAIDLADPDASYSGQSILGMGVPLAIGLGFLILGLILLVVWRLAGNERFFGRKPFESVDAMTVPAQAEPSEAA
ncbi:MAG: APC family permease [Actinobacteria bacterium]|nr:APC family permease [Actinomycetota bacterium]